MSDDQGRDAPTSGEGKTPKPRNVKKEYSRLLKHIAILEDMLLLTKDEVYNFYTFLDDRIIENRRRNPAIAAKGDSYKSYTKMSRAVLTKGLREAQKGENVSWNNMETNCG